MMTLVYHGSKEELKLKNKTSKRYGLVVLFFTTEIRLAKMYATDTGKIYKVSLKADKTINFNGQVAHSSRFRNLVFQMSKEGHDVVAIENVFDRPNDSYPFEKSTIFIVFEMDRIQNLTKCT